MNITLEEVVFINQRKQMQAFDSFLVPARNIKYVHIPQEVRALELFTIFVIVCEISLCVVNFV